MSGSSSSGSSSGSDYAQKLAREMAAIRDREERVDTSSYGSRPSGGGYSGSSQSGGRSSATDSMIFNNIRAAMSDKRSKQ